MQDSMFQLDGHVALITGCRRGIGRAMAEALAEAGADIIGLSASMETEAVRWEPAFAAMGDVSGAIDVIWGAAAPLARH